MFKRIITFSIVLFVSGCATSYTPGEMKNSYNPYVHISASGDTGVVVKASNGTRFWQIDGKRVASIPSMMFGGGYDSIKVSPGMHSFSASRGVDLDVGKVELKIGNEYYLNHLQADKRIYYWLENITTKEIVWGKRRTIEMLQAK
jgi:hypothetical protein